MLRLILLLLCTSQTFLYASNIKARKIGARKFETVEDKEYHAKVETPQGVSELNLSNLKNSAKSMGIELNSPPVKGTGTQEVFSPKSSSTVRGVNTPAMRGCGTPLNDLLANFQQNEQLFYPISGENVNVTKTIPFISKMNSSSDIEEEDDDDEESEYESEYESEDDINVGELLLEVESRRNDTLNSAFENQERAAVTDISVAGGVDIEDITEGLGNMRAFNDANSPSPVTVTNLSDMTSFDEIPTEARHEREISNRSPDVYLESVNSSDSEYESLRSGSAGEDDSVDELNLGISSTRPARTTDNTANSAHVKTADTANKTPATTAAPAVTTTQPLAMVNVMNYRSIDSVLKLNISERMILTASLHEQVSKSDNFQSPIKFAEMPHGIFMYKISLVVRRYRKELLTRNEMECSHILIRAILACEMDLKDLFEVIELLKRAGREYVSDKIVFRIVIPHLIHLHNERDEANGEKLEKNTLNNLSLYGHVLLLNEFLKHAIIGKALRSHLNFYDIQLILERLITNGAISDQEIAESMELLLKGYDLEEFKSSKHGKELAELCETNRKELMK